jgi:hypothetical protein
MDNTGIQLDTDLPAGSADVGPHPHSWAGHAFRAFLALLVAAFGGIIAVLVPLLAIDCGTCEDGVRNPRYVETLAALAWYVVPATTLATIVVLFLPRRGMRLGAVGAGVLVVLLVLVLSLGQIPA